MYECKIKNLKILDVDTNGDELIDGKGTIDYLKVL